MNPYGFIEHIDFSDSKPSSGAILSTITPKTNVNAMSNEFVDHMISIQKMSKVSNSYV